MWSVSGCSFGCVIISSLKWLLGLDDPFWCLCIFLGFLIYLHVASIAMKYKEEEVRLHCRVNSTK